MDPDGRSNTSNDILEAECAKRTKTATTKKREGEHLSEKQKQDKEATKKAKAAASAQRAVVRQQNLVHDPSPAEIQAYINDPARQVSREATQSARFQDPILANQLNHIQPQKRSMHTNQIAMQIHESRQASTTRSLASSERPALSQVRMSDPSVNQVSAHPSRAVQNINHQQSQLGHIASVSSPAHAMLAQNARIIRYPSNLTSALPSRHNAKNSGTRINSSSKLDRSSRQEKKKIMNAKRPTLGKINDDDRRRALAKSLDIYSSYLMAKDPFRVYPIKDWAEKALQDACIALDLEKIPWIKVTRKFVPSVYFLHVPVGHDCENIVNRNRQQVTHLLSEARFSHQDHAKVVAQTPYMCPIFQEILKECVFKSRDSCGMEYPVIWGEVTLEHLAFLATLVEKVLKEWLTGHHVETPFVIEDQRDVYKQHLAKLQEQYNTRPDIMGEYCQRLVKEAREALGSGPNSSQQPKSGVSSTSIQLWAQKYPPMLLFDTSVGSNALIGANDLIGPSHYTDSSSYLGDYSSGGDSYNIGTFTDSSTQPSLMSENGQYKNTSDPNPEAPQEFSLTLGRPPDAPLHPFNCPGPSSLRQDQDFQQLRAAIPTVNPDTQTESEVDSYVTLRPSQSVSQGRRSDDGSVSPPTQFEKDAVGWENDWIDARSISQGHAEEFSIRYPTPPVAIP
ncbi:hypothetical protein RhiJN_24437 [Ceratobasidium sp. AG-Ba]|nr:hypothetical protein RhiJN_24437 [Ceratobasidium sp. AG-Ba]